MKPYSIELREKIVKIYEQGDTSGHVQPQQQGGSLKSVLNSRTNELL